MLRNKNAMFIGLLLLLALSEAGLVNSLSGLIHRYGEIWLNVLSATGFSGAMVAVIRRLLEVLR